MSETEDTRWTPKKIGMAIALVAAVAGSGLGGGALMGSQDDGCSCHQDIALQVKELDATFKIELKHIERRLGNIEDALPGVISCPAGKAAGEPLAWPLDEQITRMIPIGD